MEEKFFNGYGFLDKFANFTSKINFVDRDSNRQLYATETGYLSNRPYVFNNLGKFLIEY